jgi:hypothetical protein
MEYSLLAQVTACCDIEQRLWAAKEKGTKTQILIEWGGNSDSRTRLLR